MPSSLNTHKLSIIIPLYNEEQSILTLIEKVMNAPLSIPREIIIVDDGSKDHSYAIVKHYIEQHPEASIKLLHKSNGGKGSAFRMGVENSTGSVVINQDADLEYDPNDFQACIDPILSGKAHVVYGSRELGKRHASAHFMFLLGGYAVTLATNFLYGANLTDEPTCYKAFDGPLIRTLSFNGNRFDWEPEITAKLLRLGFKIQDVPINYHPRSVSEGKKIQFFDGLDALWTLLKWRFLSLSSLKKKLRNVPESAQSKTLLPYKNVLRQNTQLTVFFVMAFLIAAVLRIAFSWPSFEDPLKYFSRPDSSMYIQGAMSILNDGTYAANGNLTSFYPPGYSLFLAGIFAVFGKIYWIAPIIGIFINCAVMWLTYLTAKCFTSSRTIAIFAMLFIGLNPTMIAHSVLYLSDTLFLLFVVLQLFCFSLFWKRDSAYGFVLSMVFAAVAAYIRPVTLMWWFPALFMLAIKHNFSLTFKFKLGIISAILFFAILTPWSLRNYNIGHGMNMTSSAATVYRYHMNVATIAARTKKNSDALRASFIAQDNAHFAANPERFQTLSARNNYIMEKAFEEIKEHPFQFLKQHVQYKIWLPDIPTLCENLKITTSGRGTFDILNRKGVVAALQHYFNGHMALFWALTPFVFIVGITYFGLFIEIAVTLWKRQWGNVLFFLAGSYYFMFVAGGVTMPRYQMPALVIICILSVLGYRRLFNVFKALKHFR